jgi:hypothetical protein
METKVWVSECVWTVLNVYVILRGWVRWNLKSTRNRDPAVCSSSHQYGLEACTVYGRSCSVVGFMMSAEPAKMVALMEAFMKEEQCSVFHFLVSDGNKHIKIHFCIKLQYSTVCLSLPQVYKLSRNFKNGVSSVTDATWPGQAHRVIMLQTVAEADASLGKPIMFRWIQWQSWFSSPYHPWHVAVRQNLCKVGAVHIWLPSWR